MVCSLHVHYACARNASLRGYLGEASKMQFLPLVYGQWSSLDLQLSDSTNGFALAILNDGYAAKQPRSVLQASDVRFSLRGASHLPFLFLSGSKSVK